MPESLFARLFLLVSLLSGVLVCVGGYGIHLQTVELVEREANHRLTAGASAIAAHLWPYLSDPGEANAVSLFREVLGPSDGLGWIKCVYWIDMSASAPTFLATLSFPLDDGSLPEIPTLDQLEDALDDGLDLLETGRPFFPNPRILYTDRLYKTIFMPIMDHHGLLHSVVGLEADSSLLQLRASLRQMLSFVLLAAVLSAFLASWLIAGSVSRHADRLIANLRHIEKREPVADDTSGIREFEALHQGIVNLGNSIVLGDQRLQQMYEKKMNELFLTGAAVAHQLRNPLAAAELHLGLVKRNPACTESLREIELGLEQMKNLVTRFLGYSKKAEAHPVRIDASSWFAEWISRMKSRYPGIEFQCTVEESLVLYADPDLLSEILTNLVQNSVEAVPGSVRISIDCRRLRSDTIRLVFQDNGPGIPDDFIPNLFTPFSSRKARGIGLGLALARKFVEAHYGTIDYQAGSSGGAGFVIELPGLPRSQDRDFRVSTS